MNYLIKIYIYENIFPLSASRCPCLSASVSLYVHIYMYMCCCSVTKSRRAQPHGLQHSQAPLSFTISQSLLAFMCIELVMLSNHLILCWLLLLLSGFPSISVFSSESALQIRWPKYWSFSFSICPSSEYSELISFRMDWLDLLAVQGLSRVFPNTAIQKHQFFGSQYSLWSNSHIHA